MIIYYDNTHSFAHDMTNEEMQWLRTYLTFDVGASFRTDRLGNAKFYQQPAESFLDPVDSSFPSGLLPMVARRAEEDEVRLSIIDMRKALPPFDAQVDLNWLRDYQVEAYRKATEIERGILWLPTGSGKCFGRGTPVLTHKGFVKAIEDVQEGEALLGPDEAPRAVLTTTVGTGDMYSIQPAMGLRWTCNREHLLVLFDTLRQVVIEVEVGHFLEQPEVWRHSMRLVRQVPVIGLGLMKFEAKHIGWGTYYGVTLDKDHRFLLADRTIVRNTEVAAALVKASPQLSWTFLVHRAELMRQTAERFIKRGVREEEVGLFGGGEADELRRITVATYQTLWKRFQDPVVKARYTRSQGIICDECHTAPADKFREVVLAFRQARYRIGLSGTPLDRSDRRAVLAVAALGPVIHRLKTDALVERGVLARPKVIFLRNDTWSAKTRYQGLYGECIVRSTARNKILMYAAAMAKKPCVIFVRELRHGEALLERLIKAKYRARFVSGEVDSLSRAAAIRELQSGEMEIVVATEVWQEGIDIPELASIIVGGGGKSVIATIQRAGRGMRRSAGKDAFSIWDIDDHGPEILEKHSAARLKSYRREGFKVEFQSVQHW